MKETIAFIDKRLASYYEMLGGFKILNQEAKAASDKVLLQAVILLAETAIDDLKQIKAML